jgi:hypothetical protein
MGGLVIRSYLSNDVARSKVRRVITLGSPHAGSKLAVLGVGRAAQEMKPDSPFLEALNQSIQVPEKGLLCTIYTILDNMVLPNESAKLTGDGIRSLETRPVDHIGLLYCRYTARLVRDCLMEP